MIIDENKIAEMLYNNRQCFIKEILVSGNKQYGYYRCGGEYIISSPVVFKMKRELDTSFDELDIQKKKLILDFIDWFSEENK